MVSGYPTSTNSQLVDGLLTDPRDKGVTNTHKIFDFLISKYDISQKY